MNGRFFDAAKSDFDGSSMEEWIFGWGDCVKCLILLDFLVVSWIVRVPIFEFWNDEFLWFLSEFDESLIFQWFEGVWGVVMWVFRNCHTIIMYWFLRVSRIIIEVDVEVDLWIVCDFHTIREANFGVGYGSGTDSRFICQVKTLYNVNIPPPTTYCNSIVLWYILRHNLHYLHFYNLYMHCFCHVSAYFSAILAWDFVQNWHGRLRCSARWLVYIFSAHKIFKW